MWGEPELQRAPISVSIFLLDRSFVAAGPLSQTHNGLPQVHTSVHSDGPMCSETFLCSHFSSADSIGVDARDYYLSHKCRYSSVFSIHVDFTL